MAGAEKPAAPDDLLLALLVRGRLAPGDAAGVRGPHDAAGDDALAALRAAELVEPRAGGRLGLTARGRERAAAVLARERALLAAEVAAIDGDFARCNDRVKRAITAWQVCRVGSADVPNDHRDERHDAAVVAELCAAVDASVALLAPLAAARERFAAYRGRLIRAAERVRAGARSFVSGIDVDSIHTVWWQLHAELLALQGRARGPGDT